MMFNRNSKKEPIHFGRKVNDPTPQTPETNVSPTITPQVVNAAQPVNVVIQQHSGDQTRRRSLLSIVISGTRSFLSGFWHVILDLAGLVFIVAVVIVTAGFLQTAGLFHIKLLEPLQYFIQTHFVPLFRSTIPSGKSN